MATKPVYDPLLDEVVFHDHSDKLGLSGGTLTGDLVIPATGVIWIDETNVKRYRTVMTVDGALKTTEIASNTGQAYGLLLAITQP